jgi:hypothetical protein
MNALGVVFAITRTTEEDCVACASIGELDFPVILRQSRYESLEWRPYLYFNLLVVAQYILRVTRSPSEKRSRPVTWQTAHETRPEQS